MGTTLISFPEEFQTLGLRVASRLVEDPKFKGSLEDLLDGKVHAKAQASVVKAGGFLLHAQKLLGLPGDGRRAVLIALAEAGENGLLRDALMNVWAAAENKPHPHARQALGILSGITRGAQNVGLVPTFMERPVDTTYMSKLDNHKYVMNKDLAKAIQEATKED